MEAHIELRDATRKISVRWHYNSGTAQVNNLLTGGYIGTLAVVGLTVNPSVIQFKAYVDANIDSMLEGMQKAAESNAT